MVMLLLCGESFGWDQEIILSKLMTGQRDGVEEQAQTERYLWRILFVTRTTLPPRGDIKLRVKKKH
jgi:hypothetical protein